MDSMKSIPILGTKFKVLTQSSSDFPQGEIAHSFLVKRKIVLPNDVEKDVFSELYYHEICHMVLGISGLAEILDEKVEEAICSVMGVAMSQLKHETLVL